MNQLTSTMSNGQSTVTLDPAAADEISKTSSTSEGPWNGLRVAIAHHWFLSRAGGERVFDSIASIFPTADVFTLFFDKKKFPAALHQHKITTSFLDKIPGA